MRPTTPAALSQSRAALPAPRHRTGPALTAICVSLLLASAGCRREAPPPAALERVAERGPIRYVLRVTPSQCRVGDRLRIEQRVTLPEGFEVELPDADTIRTALGDEAPFELVAVEADPPRPAGPKLRLWRQVIALDVLAGGQVRLPPLPVRYRRGELDASWQTLEPEPLELPVRSALTTQDAPTRPRDIRGPLVPREPAWRRALVAAAWLIGIAALLAAGYVLWRRLSRPASAPPIPPDLWAQQALDALRCEDWANPDAVRAYYYRISQIVRQYVERQFGVSAPEMTTEEFLATLRSDPQRLGFDVQRLGEFLDACDRVKYAALHPTEADARAVLAAARVFIRETAARVAARRAVLGEQAA